MAWGRRAEDLAHRYLQTKGFQVVERNWADPARRGEVDILAWDGDRLVFVEVKSRRNAEFGDPERAIGEEKIKRLRRAAWFFLRRWRIPEEKARFDLVTVLFEPFEIRHIPDSWSLHRSD
ncbi:YraN family protein [Paludibaculum fermentans]|uniref:YraN family protein n=1 Tax=Paludibaculum fermentans TaxID=1473598 RepID=UPI003EB7CE70